MSIIKKFDHSLIQLFVTNSLIIDGNLLDYALSLLVWNFSTRSFSFWFMKRWIKIQNLICFKDLIIDLKYILIYNGIYLALQLIPICHVNYSIIKFYKLSWQKIKIYKISDCLLGHRETSHFGNMWCYKKLKFSNNFFFFWFFNYSKNIIDVNDNL